MSHSCGVVTDLVCPESWFELIVSVFSCSVLVFADTGRITDADGGGLPPSEESETEVTGGARVSCA